MKKSTKIALILAAILVAAGIGTIIAGLATVNFDLSRLNTSNYIKTEEAVIDPFSEISINCPNGSIRILPSKEEACLVVFSDIEQADHVVKVQDGILRISRDDNRKWYDLKSLIGFFAKSPEITVYLPAAEYEGLTVKTASGDIFISNISAKSVSLKSTSGDILLENASGCTQFSAEATSGDIRIENVVEGGTLDITSTSGKITVFNASCRKFSSTATSGDITLTDVTTGKALHIAATSGEVEFTRCDAAEITVNTTSGDVTGSVLSEKLFRANTTSGDTVIPKGNSGGICDITTTSGDIYVDIFSGS